MRAAYHRALSRTAQTVKARAKKLLKDELQVKTAKLIRKRLQTYRLKSPTKERELDTLKIWAGSNEIPVGFLKGRIKPLGKNKSRPTSIQFTPSGKVPVQEYKGGFVLNRYKRKSIFLRKDKGSHYIREARAPIHGQVNKIIQDELAIDVVDIFMRHYETDIKARVRMGMNKKNWRE